MPSKDFENYELRVQKLREESREYFDRAEKYFGENYEVFVREVFPRDILGAKRDIAARFVVHYAESLRDGQKKEAHDILREAVVGVVQSFPITPERKDILIQNILNLTHTTKKQEIFFEKSEDITRDPFFALVEDFSLDGAISKEEFFLLEQSFREKNNFMQALEVLPDALKKLFLVHIELSLSTDRVKKEQDFRQEYSAEIEAVEKKYPDTQEVLGFIMQSYYKTPGKYRAYEHPQRRLRRTMKLALLKLLRIKLGNVEAEKILEQFEAGESFEEYFLILYRLFEIISKNPQSEEIYRIIEAKDTVKSDVVVAEENTKKILEGDFLVTKIASLFAKSDGKGESAELEDGVLEKLLDESTDIVGEDIYFNRESDMAGVYSDKNKQDREKSKEKEQEEEEEKKYRNMSPEVAYEILRSEFLELETQKTQAFARGEYGLIDEINEKLLRISLRLEKLTKILYLEE